MAKVVVTPPTDDPIFKFDKPPQGDDDDDDLDEDDFYEEFPSTPENHTESPQPTASPQLAHSQPTASPQSAHSQPTASPQLAHSQPHVNQLPQVHQYTTSTEPSRISTDLPVDIHNADDLGTWDLVDDIIDWVRWDLESLHIFTRYITKEGTKYLCVKSYYAPVNLNQLIHEVGEGQFWARKRGKSNKLFTNGAKNFLISKTTVSNNIPPINPQPITLNAPTNQSMQMQGNNDLAGVVAQLINYIDKRFENSNQVRGLSPDEVYKGQIQLILDHNQKMMETRDKYDEKREAERYASEQRYHDMVTKSMDMVKPVIEAARNGTNAPTAPVNTGPALNTIEGLVEAKKNMDALQGLLGGPQPKENWVTNLKQLAESSEGLVNLADGLGSVVETGLTIGEKFRNRNSATETTSTTTKELPNKDDLYSGLPPNPWGIQ